VGGSAWSGGRGRWCGWEKAGVAQGPRTEQRRPPQPIEAPCATCCGRACVDPSPHPQPTPWRTHAHPSTHPPSQPATPSSTHAPTHPSTHTHRACATRWMRRSARSRPTSPQRRPPPRVASRPAPWGLSRAARRDARSAVRAARRRGLVCCVPGCSLLRCQGCGSLGRRLLDRRKGRWLCDCRVRIRRRLQDEGERGAAAGVPLAPALSPCWLGVFGRRWRRGPSIMTAPIEDLMFFCSQAGQRGTGDEESEEREIRDNAQYYGFIYNERANTSPPHHCPPPQIALAVVCGGNHWVGSVIYPSVFALLLPPVTYPC